MFVALVATQNNRCERHRGMWLLENKVARAKFQTHRCATNIILLRNERRNGGNQSRMLLERIENVVRGFGGVDSDANAFVLGLNQAEGTVACIRNFSGPKDAPVTFLIAKVGIDLV